MLKLTEQQKNRLKNLSKDKETVEALKTLFLSVYFEKGVIQDIQVLAAKSLAVDFLEAGFKELSRLHSESSKESQKENIV